MLEFLKEVVLDATIDTIKILPFIFIIYILMEILESVKNKEKLESALQGKFAPIVASFTGVVPECGFSVGLAKLFDSGLITIGTLISAFIATSDEGLIVLISNGVNVKDILLLVFIKIIYAIVVGIIIDLLFKKLNNKHTCPEKGDCIECGEHHSKFIDKFILHPLIHSLKILLFIFIVNVLFGALFFYVGEERLNAFLLSKVYFQPLFACLIGLIPNCASSTIIAQVYATGGLAFGALIAGLSANAGVGLLILFKNKNNIKKNMIILLMLFGLGLFLGYSCLLLNI